MAQPQMDADGDALAGELLARLERLRPGTTMCPGKLAREFGRELKDLRPLLVELWRKGQLEVTQGGEPVDPEQVKGPIRVSRPE